MTCSETRRLFGRRLDARLDAGEARALAGHLAGCSACRAELAAWERAARALRGSGPSPVPPGLAERAARASLDAAPPATAGPFVTTGRRALLAGAAAAAAVWIGAELAGRASSRPEAAPQDPMEVAVQLWTTEVSFDGD